MFTGIIEQTGRVQAIGEGSLAVVPGKQWPDALTIGESIAVNGVCLTLAALEENALYFDMLQETFDKTMLGQLQVGDVVNLERALQVGSRLGGHVVQGHVDGRGGVESIELVGEDRVIRINCPESILNYLAYKGSICVNGISLTLASVTEDGFTVHIIPHTWSETALRGLKAGDSVNLEVDILAKYVSRQLESGRFPPPPEWDDLGIS